MGEPAETYGPGACYDEAERLRGLVERIRDLRNEVSDALSDARARVAETESLRGTVPEPIRDSSLEYPVLDEVEQQLSAIDEGALDEEALTELADAFADADAGLEERNEDARESAGK